MRAWVGSCSRSATDMIRRLAVTRPSRAVAGVATVAWLLVASACGGSLPDAEPDDSARSSTDSATPSDKYVPEGDEGLGASIAIVIDKNVAVIDVKTDTSADMVSRWLANVATATV